MARQQLLPEEIVAEVDREIQEAQELADTLEQKVRDGDETVEYEQIEKARGLKRFAELRREAALKKAEALEKKLAAASYEKQFREHLDAFDGLADQINPLIAEAADLVSRAIGLAAEQNHHVVALATLAETAGNPYHREDDPELVGEVPMTTAGPMPAFAWFRAGSVEGHVISKTSILEQLSERIKR